VVEKRQSVYMALETIESWLTIHGESSLNPPHYYLRSPLLSKITITI
jgi:hypothetical protein